MTGSDIVTGFPSAKTGLPQGWWGSNYVRCHQGVSGQEAGTQQTQDSNLALSCRIQMPRVAAEQLHQSSPLEAHSPFGLKEFNGAHFYSLAFIFFPFSITHSEKKMCNSSNFKWHSNLLFALADVMFSISTSQPWENFSTMKPTTFVDSFHLPFWDGKV